MAIGPDRVQAYVNESTVGGGDSADSTYYQSPLNPQEDALESAGLYLQDASNRDEAVYLERIGKEIRLVDQFNPGHTLAHLAGATQRTCYEEVTRVSGLVTDISIWTTSGKTQKIKGTAITRTSGLVSSIVETRYDANGTLLAGGTFTKTITRASGLVTSIAVVQS